MLLILALAAATTPAQPDPPAPFENTAAIAHVVMDSGGEVASCTVETIGKGAANVAPTCDSLADPLFLRTVLGEAFERARAIDVRLLGHATGAGTPLAALDQRFDHQRLLGSADVEIGRNGHIRRCRTGEAASIAGTRFDLCDGMTGKNQDFVADPAAPDPRVMKLSFDLVVTYR